MSDYSDERPMGRWLAGLVNEALETEQRKEALKRDA